MKINILFNYLQYYIVYKEEKIYQKVKNDYRLKYIVNSIIA